MIVLVTVQILKDGKIRILHQLQELLQFNLLAIKLTSGHNIAPKRYNVTSGRPHLVQIL